jgi:hypothetical protein
VCGYVFMYVCVCMHVCVFLYTYEAYLNETLSGIVLRECSHIVKISA